MGKPKREATTDLERELVAENRRLRQLVDFLIAHPVGKACNFELISDGKNVNFLACGPVEDEERMCRIAGETFAGVFGIAAEMNKVKITGSVTVDGGVTP